MSQDKTPEFNVYSFDISITLRRQDGRYDSTNLTRFETKQEIPLASDVDAKYKMAALVNNALDISGDIVDARIDFENRVKQLTSGEVIDSLSRPLLPDDVE